MDSIIAIIQQWISSGNLIATAGGAFFGGVLAGLCPCVLVMVPLLIGFIGGMGKEMTLKRSFLYTLVFILGFSLELALLFTVGWIITPFLQSTYMLYVVAAICVLLGLHFMNVFKIPLGKSQHKPPRFTGFIGAGLFGFMFGFTSLPCTGPALVLIVSIIPATSPLIGGIMMLFYGMGQCMLILVAGTFAGAARHLLASPRFHAVNMATQKAAGVLLVLVGIYVATGALFPGFGLGF
jgi:cytochrome c-type biogenesis protein